MDNLLLEIGTEEIPAGYIEPALKSLASALDQRLTEARIDHGPSRVFGTPRRLAVQIDDVAPRQAPLTEEVVGPPERVGFDANGKPTTAAVKFAEKVGVPVNRIRIKETGKGRYLCAIKTERGGPTLNMLKTMLPAAILATPFPKSMRWADLNISFARPIHWILALFGEKTVSFGLGGIRSGRHSCGHRFVSPGKIRIDHSDQYVEALRSACVLADSSERRTQVADQVRRTASALGGKIIEDAELVDIVNNLVEFPAVSAGKFEAKYLEVPDVVLITAMRKHQKYFAVVDADQRLLPCFIAVNNTPARNMDLVARGHERVLRARLEDARFFFQSDLADSMDQWKEKLNGVLFQARLGTMYEKTKRVRQLAEHLCGRISDDPRLKIQVGRAADLCKADLVCQVVGEFPELQGIMGRVYAQKAGEDPLVATAIEEHYRPTFSGGPLPETLPGAIVAIADKIDSICGCFGVGLIPTGASDPYALRRQAIGVVQIMLDKGFSFSLTEAVQKSLDLFIGLETGGCSEPIIEFFRSRISHLLAEEGFSKDVIAAVAGVSVDHVPNVWKRVRALEALKAHPDFDSIAVAFKRVVNIIRKAGDVCKEDKIDESLFEDATESALYGIFQQVRSRVADKLDHGLFDAALEEIASLRKPVDAFFDGVMVMSENTALRRNRLALLERISCLFGMIADFSKIST